MSESPNRPPSIGLAMREQIKAAAAHDWCHQIEIDDSGAFVPAENLRYRVSVLRAVFESLLRGRSVLILNETTGFYPVLACRAGAAKVTANNALEPNCQVMASLASLTGERFEIIPQALMAFEDSGIYVDLDRAGTSEFLFAQNAIWGLFNAAGQSFDDVVEACAHYVTEGLIFDWTDASWAKPPPPNEYSLENFLRVLRSRFEYVVACNDWLTIALGKLPVDP